MAMRDLVTGGADCAVPGSSSSNPLGALANALIGSSSKTQVGFQFGIFVAFYYLGFFGIVFFFFFFSILIC